ncbi:hypothetical protein BGX28_009328 [Mortierella sp. GBA30]|nr:hypothetical protein BGX28_009328 [Mortierella sp. GBA30]
MALSIFPVAIAFGSSNLKTEPLAASVATTARAASASLSIHIPAKALTALERANANSPPLSPPYLSSSASSTGSFESLPDAFTVAESPVASPAEGKIRRLSREFFFPNQSKFETAAPEIVKARDLNLKDHLVADGAFDEYDKLYNADSLMTKDGRPMVRLLSPATTSTVRSDETAQAKARRLSREFFFPHQSKFESAAPEIVKAKDIHLKDHPVAEGAFAEYEQLYNADSVMTKDGRPMVRLLSGTSFETAEVKARRASREFFFPHQSKFERAAPEVVKAKDIHLKDYPVVEGAFAEYERLYNADSVMTKDGRAMVRLL